MVDERWEPFFEDLEQQFAAEREAAAGELAGEAERLRIARLALRDRIAAVGAGATLALDDIGGEGHELRLEAVGADWVAGTSSAPRGMTILRAGAIAQARFAPADRARSLEAALDDPLLRRMTFGFVLRALARRRAPLALGLASGRRASGTASLVGGDHLDLAVHDADLAPRAADVRETRTIAFDAIAWVRTSRRDVGVF